MAYLKSTSIVGDLDVSGGVTTGSILRNDSNEDHYLGTGEEIPTGSDLYDLLPNCNYTFGLSCICEISRESDVVNNSTVVYISSTSLDRIVFNTYTKIRRYLL